MVDLSRYDLKQLNAFRIQIDKAITRQTIIEKKNALEEVKAFAKAKGVSLDELSAEGKLKKRASKTGRRVARGNSQNTKVKYRHPDRQELTWSGRGRKPKWIHEWEKTGKAMVSLEV